MRKEGFFSIKSPFNSTKFKEKEKTAQVRIICPKTRHLATSGVCGPSSLRICTTWRSVAMATWPVFIIGPSGCPLRKRRTCPTKKSRTWYLCYHLPGWDLEGQKQRDLGVLSPLLFSTISCCGYLQQRSTSVCSSNQLGLAEFKWFHLLPSLHHFS